MCPQYFQILFMLEKLKTDSSDFHKKKIILPKLLYYDINIVIDSLKGTLQTSI